MKTWTVLFTFPELPAARAIRRATASGSHIGVVLARAFQQVRPSIRRRQITEFSVQAVLLKNGTMPGKEATS